MNEIHLRGVDLNLLTVFDAVYSAGQVTRAADSLGLTQPAVSHALRRLRDQFGDALFVRQRQRMVPTPRAHEIAPQVAAILADIRRVMGAPAAFDPAEAAREIRIGMLDYGMALFASDIAALIDAEAPGVRIDFRHVRPDEALPLMQSGEMDIGVGPYGALPAEFGRTTFLRDSCVVVARGGHPAIGRSLTLETYAALGHIKFANLPLLDRVIDDRLAESGLARRTVMTVAHYSSAMFTVSQSDHIVTITRGPAELFGDLLGLDLFPPPVELPFNEISIVASRRALQDPLIAWFRDRFLARQNRLD